MKMREGWGGREERGERGVSEEQREQGKNG